jgi:hypothetical protein
MVLIGTMRNADNENEPLTFEPIGLAAERIANLLHSYFSERTEKQKEQTDGDTGRSRTEKEKTDEHARYVDQRLRELRSFERRFTKG